MGIKQKLFQQKVKMTQTVVNESQFLKYVAVKAELIDTADKRAKEKELEERQAKLQKKEEERERRRISQLKKACFDKYDLDGDGVLQRSELNEYIKDLCKRNNMPEPADVFINMLFNSCDEDKSDTIDFNEFLIHFGQYAN